MTTIILTIIGILLAAAAALMVIFYGGDAFNGGSIGAQANTFQNAGTNVVSAVELARANNAPQWTSVADLHSVSDPDSDYLKELPSLPNGDSGELATSTTQTVGTPSPYAQYTAAITDTNAAKVCARVNTNLKRTAPTSLDDGKMGCFASGSNYTFFANA